ncbi:hypothetical protein HanRHA438_Chr02g0058921 [Helianthus annuus]|uniref:Uncharacterized protein n=1 Tax=Helianthus annuus TaxID=4232 RepID=A0A9K3JMH3_HELAN|nr:hypothetical protein HanXRQr2_Chr02g0057121 [Helianthus annuus]KAJ0604208.1 hypothetical protein HanHA300_Chr02g0047111 [Helianthus annuus]KAJ0618223.1 hypothetical protein HanHA89_Chr02g0050741 [Helianthus annuus]KAJ0776685.1 hypothetical protein HanLR1_Chr02g0048491 [Helianthus annuus]KAJ0939244.1 hypothetical protein HanRHA438_Chr02g0058921 [Helianthus annuus]
MGRKGKELVGSSSQPENSPRKSRLVLQADVDEEEEEEEQQQQQVDISPKPRWDSGPLDDQPEYWQPILFHEQMNKLKDRAATFICKKEVREVDVGPYNVIDRFKTLGWEVALNCYDRDNKNLFKGEIQEWMTTLRSPKYYKPEQMKLIRTMNNVDVEMCFENLRRLAKFDSNPAREYMFASLDDL